MCSNYKQNKAFQLLTDPLYIKSKVIATLDLAVDSVITDVNYINWIVQNEYTKYFKQTSDKFLMISSDCDIRQLGKELPPKE